MLASRRPRMHRVASQKPFALTGRDIEVLRCLVRYRYLRSTYLHAFAGGASEKRFIERLCDLFHHGFVARASQQWQYAEARCQPLIYECEGRARRLLAGAEDVFPRTYLGLDAQRQFVHALTICECLASIEMATSIRDDMRFIAWPEILARAPEDARASAIPFRLAIGRSAVIPDALFGIEYVTGGRRAYRFFALEVDRGTMPIVRRENTMTSVMGKLSAYGELIAAGRPRALLGIPNLFVLTITSSDTRAANLLATAEGAPSAPWFLFKAVAQSALRKPLMSLLTDPWDRPGLSSLSIAQ